VHDVHVIDTSSLIQLVDDVMPAPLWRVLEACTTWVEGGKLVFPIHVELELRSYNVPDSITVWSAGVMDRRKYPDPSYETVKKVMANPVVAKVVDWGKSSKTDPADPYVLAQAVELQAAGKSVCIVNEDKRDKNDGYGKLKKSSIHTCCATLKIASMVTSQFLPLLGVKL
jgi:hypothetical protein